MKEKKEQYYCKMIRISRKDLEYLKRIKVEGRRTLAGKLSVMIEQYQKNEG